MSQDEWPEDEEGRARALRRNSSAPQAAPSGLLALPERQCEAIVLRNYMGLTERQVASAMNISIGAVRSHLARGMVSLNTKSTTTRPGLTRASPSAPRTTNLTFPALSGPISTPSRSAEDLS
jgi:DNA-binding NarL/FixJ family response regulator